MSKHMKKKDMTWRELFDAIQRYAKKDGDSVWDLPVSMWADDDTPIPAGSIFTFSGVHAEYMLYPSYTEAPISDENWMVLNLNTTN